MMDNFEEDNNVKFEKMLYVYNDNGHLTLVDFKDSKIPYNQNLYNQIYKDIDIWIGNNGLTHYKTNLNIKKYICQGVDYYVNFSKLF